MVANDLEGERLGVYPVAKAQTLESEKECVRKKGRTAAPLPCRPEISTTDPCRVVPRRLSRSPTPVEVSGSNRVVPGRPSTSLATRPGTAHRSITASTQRSNVDNGIKSGGSFLQISNAVAEKKRSASETIPRVRRASTRAAGKTSGDNDDRRMVVRMEDPACRTMTLTL
jgi:hypothetical protein